MQPEVGAEIDHLRLRRLGQKILDRLSAWWHAAARRRQVKRRLLPVDAVDRDELRQLERRELREHGAHLLPGPAVSGEQCKFDAGMAQQQSHQLRSGVSGGAEDAEFRLWQAFWQPCSNPYPRSRNHDRARPPAEIFRKCRGAWSAGTRAINHSPRRPLDAAARVRIRAINVMGWAYSGPPFTGQESRRYLALGCASAMISAARSASDSVGACVLQQVISGMTEASATRSGDRPRTLQRSIDRRGGRGPWRRCRRSGNRSPALARM